MVGIFWLSLVRKSDPLDFDERRAVRALIKKGPLIFSRTEDLCQFKDSLKQWQKTKISTHPILVISGHGTNGGKLKIGVETVPLNCLFKMLGENACGVWIHLSVCSAMARNKVQIEQALVMSGALGVSGYTRDIESSLALELDLALLKAIRTGVNAPRKMARALNLFVLEKPAFENGLTYCISPITSVP